MKKLYKRKDLNMELNLTSLMDMFTILLFFFLTSYSFEGVFMRIEEGIDLPYSKSRIPISERSYIAIGKDKITIENISYSITGKDDVEILKHLKEIKSKGVNYIVIQADRDLQFYRIRNYIRLAVQAGFPKPFLAVVPR
ncbi:MAG: biopolymer transporter ExbD [Proteobacteria bacterium]|nr:biopolymer transporter ExbD [Pseudomonadota bacterium]